MDANISSRNILSKAIKAKVDIYCRENDANSTVTFIHLLLIDRLNSLPTLEKRILKILLITTHILKLPFPTTLADRWVLTTCSAAALELNFNKKLSKGKYE